LAIFGHTSPIVAAQSYLSRQVSSLTINIRQVVKGIAETWNNRVLRLYTPPSKKPARRRAGKLGSDRVMGMNRMAAGVAMVSALWAINDEVLATRWSGPVVIWLLFAVVLFLWSGVKRYADLRRALGLVIDVFGTTTMLLAGGSETAFLYAVYLWVIIGYGFRFGVRYLISSSLLSMAGFVLVIATDSFWRGYLSLSIGLLVGLAVLPAYSFALIRQLAKARRRAEQADRAKSLFLASVSHELRTPLHAIIGMTEALRATPLDDNQSGMIETINTAAEGQASLVADLLEYSMTDAGGGQSSRNAFDLTDLVAKVIAIVSAEGRKKGLLINSYITARTPLRLIGDERRIQEVLLNLCSNATKFTDHGSVTISADGVLSGDGKVSMRIEVMDTGIGIAPEYLDKVFNQGDENIFRRFGGTGLGLALCRQRVAVMGGQIEVDSVVASGSTFQVSLPLQALTDDDRMPGSARVLVVAGEAAQASALQERLAALEGMGESGLVLEVTYASGQATRDGAANAMIHVDSGPVDGLPGRAIREVFSTSISLQSTEAELKRAVLIASSQLRKVQTADLHQRTDNSADEVPDLNGLRVLVADDNKVNRLVMSKMISRVGGIAILAANGDEALAVLSDGKADLALLDVNMPGLNGIETAQLYKFTMSEDQRVPLLALTADESADTKAQCLQAGMSAFLVKPVRTVSLLEAVKNVLSGRVPAAAEIIPSSDVKVVLRLDHQALAELESLGGPEFVDQLVADFKHDCLESLSSLTVALALQDVQRFRFEAHSISSTAGNLGARSLQKMCSPLSRIGENVFRSDGTKLVAQLRQEWERTSFDLDRRSTAGAGAGPSMGTAAAAGG
jgi:two-component system, sensor histidine kinase RpfC